MSKVLFFLFVLMFWQMSHAEECQKTLQEELLQKTLTPSSTTGLKVVVSSSLVRNEALPFVPRRNALAMNINYAPIVKLRQDIQKILNLPSPLKFLTEWERNGEAHVTVVTPPETKKLFAENEKYLSKARMDEIAKENKIQSSDLKIIGIGSGKALIHKCYEHTFFLIVESAKLLEIRRKIHNQFVAGGGKTTEFNPDQFFPHITIGYTKRDLHESDGLLKGKRSLDPRFTLVLEPSL